MGQGIRYTGKGSERIGPSDWMGHEAPGAHGTIPTKCLMPVLQETGRLGQASPANQYAPYLTDGASEQD